MEHDSGHSKGCAIVSYRTETECHKAIEELHGSLVGNRNIDAREDRKKGRCRAGDPRL